MCSFQGVKALNGIPVAIAKGIHLFPSRTQKLSLSAPMVLGWRRPGRVGRCRIPHRKAPPFTGGAFLCGNPVLRKLRCCGTMFPLNEFPEEEMEFP